MIENQFLVEKDARCKDSRPVKENTMNKCKKNKFRVAGSGLRVKKQNTRKGAR